MILIVHDCKEPLFNLWAGRERPENISHSFSFTMASRSKCRSVPTDQLESVMNEIYADDESSNEIMISELDEIDSDNNTVIDSHDEHLATMSAVPDTSISWTYGDIVPTVVPGSKLIYHIKWTPFQGLKFF
jgi:hypothetical protein